MAIVAGLNDQLKKKKINNKHYGHTH